MPKKTLEERQIKVQESLAASARRFVRLLERIEKTVMEELRKEKKQ